jgi:hypothetical protein
VIVIFLFLKQINTNNISKIQKINTKYLVDNINLLPINEQAYIAELNVLNEEQYTKPITDFVKLNIRAKQIYKLIQLNKIKNTNCISTTLLLKVNSIQLYKNNLLDLFNEQKNNTKLNKIYWNEYIDILTNLNQLQELQLELNKIEMCK